MASQSNDMQSIPVKMEYNGDMRRFRCKAPLSTMMGELCVEARRIFGLSADQAIKFSYRDDEDDVIVVTTYSELVEAVSNMKSVLHLTLVLAGPPTAPHAAEPAQARVDEVPPEALVRALNDLGIKNPVNIQRVYNKFGGDEDKVMAHFAQVLEERKAKRAAPKEAPAELVNKLVELGIKNPVNIQRIYNKFDGEEDKVMAHFAQVLEERKAKRAATDAAMEEAPAELVNKLVELGIKNHVSIQRVYNKFGGNEDKVMAHFAQVLEERKAKRATPKEAPAQLVKKLVELGIKNPVNINRIYNKFNGDEDKVIAHFEQVLEERKAKRAAPVEAPSELVNKLVYLGIKNPANIHRVFNKFGGDEEKVMAFFQERLEKRRSKPAASNSNGTVKQEEEAPATEEPKAAVVDVDEDREEKNMLDGEFDEFDDADDDDEEDEDEEDEEGDGVMSHPMFGGPFPHPPFIPFHHGHNHPYGFGFGPAFGHFGPHPYSFPTSPHLPADTADSAVPGAPHPFSALGGGFAPGGPQDPRVMHGRGGFGRDGFGRGGFGGRGFRGHGGHHWRGRHWARHGGDSATAEEVPAELTAFLKSLGVEDEQDIARAWARFGGDADQVAAFFLRRGKCGWRGSGGWKGRAREEEEDEGLKKLMEEARQSGCRREWVVRRLYRSCDGDLERAREVLRKHVELRQRMAALHKERAEVRKEWQQLIQPLLRPHAHGNV